mmetsp:Transcript_91585/g.262363  ORF Transcript_91585/g.262363 Transcript_91585/m.262363 type:complete len:418 (+) Transcript_91585:99-1352(+)
MKTVLAAACMSAAGAVVVQNQGSSFLARQQSSADPPSNKEIHEKWDKMDDFMEIMFTIACKWKHGKDVDGATSEALKKGKVDGPGAMVFKKGIQKDNLQGLTSACGMVVASGEGKCRQGCADRWGKAMGKRNACDGKCVASYDQFESRCKAKVANLEKVYEMKVTAENSRNTCYNGHCKEFPQVWMKATEADMTTEVETQCKKRCTPEQITARCETKWTLQVDFLRDSVKSKCAAESGVTDCFTTKTADVSAAYDKCSSEGKTTCETQATECSTKGNADKSLKQAGEFCAERKKMCLEQVDTNCLADNKAGLGEAEGECEAEAKTAFEKCEDDALAAKETESLSLCNSDLTPKCLEDCGKKCDVATMQTCLTNLKSKSDPAEEFCTDFWKLLHESSEIDPITGDPIVLLSSKKRLTQ